MGGGAVLFDEECVQSHRLAFSSLSAFEGVVPGSGRREKHAHFRTPILHHAYERREIFASLCDVASNGGRHKEARSGYEIKEIHSAQDGATLIFGHQQAVQAEELAIEPRSPSAVAGIRYAKGPWVISSVMIAKQLATPRPCKAEERRSTSRAAK